MMSLSAIIVLFVVQFVHIKSARILAVYPTPSISHQVVFRSLTDELIKHGHQITVVTTDPKYPKGQSPTNLTEIDMHDLSYGIWRDVLLRSKSADHESTALEIIFRGSSNVFKAQLNTQEFQDIIKKGEYDLLMLEAYLKPVLVLSEIFKVPVILVSSLGAVNENFRAVGVPTHPFIYPSPVQRKIYNLTNLEKLQQWYDHWTMENIFSAIDVDDDKMLKSLFGPEIPYIDKLLNNIDMLMINTHPIWLENQPVPPNTIYIGGLHLKPPQDLPKELQSYLDTSKNGVIYFSFGTNVQPELLPPQKIQMFVNVFSQLPYDVLWKWGLDTLPGKSDNIKISKWLPQADLLRHPKVKVFITQGGLQSTDEAIRAGVPMVGIPMLGDQWYNVQKYVRHGIGVQLEINTLTENEFKDAIKNVINDKSFRENIIRLRKVIEDQPMTPAERAVWWVEHIIRHGGGKHLRAAGANMTWRQYFELDLVFIVLSVIICILAIGLIIIYSLWKFIMKNISTNTKIKRS
ncbi:unnamed protein product, partial [Brenthis ino]